MVTTTTTIGAVATAVAALVGLVTMLWRRLRKTPSQVDQDSDKESVDQQDQFEKTGRPS